MVRTNSTAFGMILESDFYLILVHRTVTISPGHPGCFLVPPLCSTINSLLSKAKSHMCDTPTKNIPDFFCLPAFVFLSSFSLILYLEHVLYISWWAIFKLSRIKQDKKNKKKKKEDKFYFWRCWLWCHLSSVTSRVWVCVGEPGELGAVRDWGTVGTTWWWPL